MCFKVNTPEGSIRMLTNKKGVDLPLIPGRAIWKLGSEEVVFQAPCMWELKILKASKK